MENEKDEIKEWYLEECRKIREKYPRTKYQLDHPDEEDKEMRELNNELYARLRKKYNR